MLVIFSHGKESVPWGSKIKAMAAIAKEQGHEVDSIDYSGVDNPDERVEILSKVLMERSGPHILVGSSMGGYVSLVVSEQYACKGVFLLAPALFMPNYAVQSYSSTSDNICVVHGLSDEIIPYQHSQRYSEASGCELHLIEGDHRLNDSLDEVCAIFERFLLKLNK